MNSLAAFFAKIGLGLLVDKIFKAILLLQRDARRQEAKAEADQAKRKAESLQQVVEDIKERKAIENEGKALSDDELDAHNVRWLRPGRKANPHP